MSEASVLTVADMAGIEPKFIFVLGRFSATSMPAAPMKILLSGICRDRCYDFFKYFRRKKLAEIWRKDWRIFLKLQLFFPKMDHIIGV
jgi:hypothetical protein